MAAHIIGSIGGTQADSVPIKRALLSVSDKTGLVELGKALAAKNVELLSTGGTAKALMRKQQKQLIAEDEASKGKRGRAPLSHPGEG